MLVSIEPIFRLKYQQTSLHTPYIHNENGLMLCWTMFPVPYNWSFWMRENLKEFQGCGSNPAFQILIVITLLLFGIQYSALYRFGVVLFLPLFFRTYFWGGGGGSSLMAFDDIICLDAWIWFDYYYYVVTQHTGDYCWLFNNAGPIVRM